MWALTPIVCALAVPSQRTAKVLPGLRAIQPLEGETRWIVKPHPAQILKSAFTQGKKISPNPLANTQNPLKLVIVES